MKEVMEYAIPLLVRRGGREADGVVAHTERLLVSDHPGCGTKVGFAENFLDAAATPPPEEGNRISHDVLYAYR